MSEEYINDGISADDGDNIYDGDNDRDVADPEEINGDNGGEVADSDDNNSDNGRDVADPENMSDVDFNEYIDNIMSGVITDDDEELPQSPKATAPSEKEPDADSDPEETVFKSFKSKEEYQAEIDRIVTNRVREHRQIKSEYDELANELKDFYGVDEPEEAVKRFKQQMLRQKADESGMSEDEYVAHSETERKVKAYDAMQEQQKKISETRSRLFGEAEQIKLTDKGFDLQSAYDTDAEFKADLDNTGSVYLAYANMVKRNATKATKKTAPAPVTKTKRAFKEGAVSTTAGGRVKTSAADLSDDEFDKYIKEILNG
jgi:hypothetical protein